MIGVKLSLRSSSIVLIYQRFLYEAMAGSAYTLSLALLSSLLHKLMDLQKNLLPQKTGYRDGKVSLGKLNDISFPKNDLTTISFA